MATTTEGKASANARPMTGLQRPVQHKTNNVTGEWLYNNPYMHKTYCCLLEFGDISFERTKVAIRCPEMERFAYDDVRNEMLAGGKLETEQEAKETRKRKEQKKLQDDIERITAQGIAKNPTAVKPTVPALISQENHAPTVHNSGLRNGTVMEEVLSKANVIKEDDKFSSRLSPEAIRVRKNLDTYSLSQLFDLSFEDYKRQKSHYLDTPYLFYNHRKLVIKAKQASVVQPKPQPSPEPMPVVVAPTPVASAPAPIAEAPKTRKALNVLGNVDILDIKPEDRKLIKSKIMDALKIISKDTEAYTLVTLDDPPCIEIRETVWY